MRPAGDLGETDFRGVTVRYWIREPPAYLFYVFGGGGGTPGTIKNRRRERNIPAHEPRGKMDHRMSDLDRPRRRWDFSRSRRHRRASVKRRGSGAKGRVSKETDIPHRRKRLVITAGDAAANCSLIAFSVILRRGQDQMETLH